MVRGPLLKKQAIKGAKIIELWYQKIIFFEMAARLHGLAGNIDHGSAWARIPCGQQS